MKKNRFLSFVGLCVGLAYKCQFVKRLQTIRYGTDTSLCFHVILVMQHCSKNISIHPISD